MKEFSKLCDLVDVMNAARDYREFLGVPFRYPSNGARASINISFEVCQRIHDIYRSEEVLSITVKRYVMHLDGGFGGVGRDTASHEEMDAYFLEQELLHTSKATAPLDTKGWP